ncbi:MAG: Pvc16 family protein [Anaerolineae bacterium]
MIADLDETIKQLLVEEIPVKNGEIDIKFDQPTREWSARLTKPTVNFFLYDVRENNVLRQHQWQRLDAGNGRQARVKRTPMRVDCAYMITTWASEPDDEHRLLTRCLMALFRHPVLPEHVLVNTLQNPAFDIQAQLARHDKLTNPAEVWSALDNELRPSISYIVTLALDPWAEVTGPAVRTLTLRTNQADGLPRPHHLVPDEPAEGMIFIGGAVSKGKTAQAGIEVAIKGTGRFDKTDALGRFTLGSMPPGEYTLVAWPAKGKPKERQISVPADDYDIEL